MPYLLRQIKKPRWHEQPWLGRNEAPADSLRDLADNSLSVWHIDDDKSNLSHVVSAIAAGRQTIDKLDYACFPPDRLEQITISVVKTEGKTFSKDANASWHRELVQLSANKAAGLANIMKEYGTRDRLLEDEVVSLIQEAIRSGRIDKDKLPDKIREKIA